jgi:hypothetical protein
VRIGKANASIVAFLNSSRLLIEFFRNKEACDFDPRFFTKSTYELKKKFIRDSIPGTINAQISHLSARRTKLNAEKIGPALRKEIYDALQSEVARFGQALHPDYAKKWPIKLPQTIAVQDGQSQSSFPTFTSFTLGEAT